VRAADFEERGEERLDRLLEDLRARVLDRVEDFFEPDRLDFVSPFSRRILLTVRAATSSARPPYRPDFLALCLMCSYCRSRFGLAPRGIVVPPFSWCYQHLRES
jgi:hypothetical protein